MGADEKFSSLGRPQGKMDPTTGKWNRNAYAHGPGQKNANSFSVKLPINKDTADAAVLYKTPSGQRMLIEQVLWEVTTPFTGGTSSAIGLSANVAPYTAAGSIHGGASGELAAGLTAGIRRGTLGTGLSAAPNALVLEPETELRFNRIASQFAAGAGFVHVIGRIIE